MASTSQVHVDAVLSDFGTRYDNDDYIADLVSPIKLVDKRSGKYFTFTRADFERRNYDRLSVQGGASEVTWEMGTDNYSVEDRGLNGVLPSEVERNADAPLSPEQLETENVMNALMLEREIRVAALLMTNTSYASGNYGTVGALWSNRVTGTPLDDINAAVSALPPINDAKTYLVLSRPVWTKLRSHPDFLSLRSSNERGQVSRSELAESLEVDDILVGNTFYNAANEGQTASRTRIWSATKAAVVRVPNNTSGPYVHSFCVTFRTKPGIEVRKWRDEDRGKGGSLIIRVEFSDDEKIVQNDAGYLLEGVL